MGSDHHTTSSASTIAFVSGYVPDMAYFPKRAELRVHNAPFIRSSSVPGSRAL